MYIAPVDLDARAHSCAGGHANQAIVASVASVGMAVLHAWFSIFSMAKLVDTEGKQLSVREALSIINQVLDEVLAEQDKAISTLDSRFAIAWFRTASASTTASLASRMCSPAPRTLRSLG